MNSAEVRLRARKTGGYLTHILTASGAALGFLALTAVVAGDLPAAFAWLALALVVDAIDGPIARWLNVTDHAKRYDGSILDLVVDFITYVFVPAAMLLYGGVMSKELGLISALIVVVSSALYFADTEMKTEDWWFQGFPGVWNLVLFYLVAFPLPDWADLLIVLAFTAGMFLPIPFVHPVRVVQWRVVTIGMLGVWGIAAAVTLWQRFDTGLPAKAALLLSCSYFLLLGLSRRSRASAETAAGEQ